MWNEFDGELGREDIEFSIAIDSPILPGSMQEVERRGIAMIRETDKLME